MEEGETPQKSYPEYIVPDSDYEVIENLKNSTYTFRQIDLVQKKKKEDEEVGDEKFVRFQLNRTSQRIFDRQVDYLVHTKIHPSITQFESFCYYPKIYAVSKYYPNGSLLQILQTNPAYWNGTMKSKCVFGLVAAVTHIHNTFTPINKNFSIRYLFPENVVFDTLNEPRLINFVFGDESLGTTPNAYIPPELHEDPNHSRLDEDIWQLGMLFYEIVTGHKPYEGKSEEEIKELVINGELPELPPPNPDTDHMIGIIQNCLEKDPNKRPLPYMLFYHLVNYNGNLFPGTDSSEYENYRNKVTEPTLMSDEAKEYFRTEDEYTSAEVVTDEEVPQQMVQVGRMYMKGLNGTKINERKAFEYFKKAADKGNQIGMYNAAICLRDGRGCPVNHSMSFSLIEKAANLGLDVAVAEYGCMFRDGVGTDKDMRKAVEIFQNGADEDNNKLCQYYLASLYYEGSPPVVKKNINKALTYYRKSGQNGYGAAYADLGFHHYQNAMRSNDRDEMKKAIMFYKRAANLNSSVALLNLGRIYREGANVDKNIEQSTEYFRLSAQLKNPDGMAQYALSLRNGWGVEKDVKEALNYYHQAADKGIKLAQNNYAKLLYDGKEGVEKDVKSAAVYFKMAADQGVPPSMFFYAKIVINGEGSVPVNLKEGGKYLQKYFKVVPPERRNKEADELMAKVREEEDED